MRNSPVCRNALWLAFVIGFAHQYAKTALANPSDSTYRLVFADEFDGTTLDTNKWSAASPSWTMPNSASSASAGQVAVGNGVVTLNAVRTSSTAFTSGSFASYTTYQFTGGYVEARIDLPSTPGSWPAFWGLYTGWPPEADIMEYPITTNGGTNGLQPTQYNTSFHYSTGSGNASGAGVVNTSNLGTSGYHTFAMDWTPGTNVKFYLDNTQVQSFTNSAVAQMVYMYMIMDYAVGGWPGTPTTTQWPIGFSDQTKIDWIHVWQRNPNSDATSTWNVNGGGALTTSGNWTGGGVPSYGNQPVVFGRVGAASTASITMGNWQVMGSLTFSGDGTGTTAYTIGNSANLLQLSSTAGPFVTAASSSTVSQTIGAKLELQSNATIRNDMTGGQTLNLSGGVTGPGQLTVEGVGTVVLSGAGTYLGGTVINGGTAGPGVLRASASNALGPGGVVIGTTGNGTTARLELTGNASLPNNIDLRGRNNSSVGVQSISGSNVISGTISTNTGGSTYQIQSDSGTLSLTGLSAGATARGVALQSIASGSRTFTLQGAGSGTVSGTIRDGSGSVSIIKDGAGTWNFSGANTYSGTTVINAGTLRLSTAASVALATPIASYNFNNVSGSTVINAGSGGTALNGTLNANGGTGSINLTGGPTSALGALVLNGDGTTVDIPTGVTDLGSSSTWTVSLWVKTTQSGMALLNKGDGTNWSSGFSTFYLGDGANDGIGGIPDAVRWGGGWLAGSTSVNDGNWHLLTYTNSAGTKSVYVDGVVESLSQTQFNNADTGTTLRIGFSPNAEVDGNVRPSGSLSGVNIYNAALSATQVSTLFKNTFATAGSPLPTTTAVSIVNSGATLDVNGVQQTIASLTGPSGSAVTLGNGQLTVNSSVNTLFAGNISGTGGSLVKQGSGTLTLSGANSYTGATTVTAGTLVVTSSLNASNVANSGEIIVGSTAGSAALTLSSGTFNATRSAAPSVSIGDVSGATGTLTISSGTLSATNGLYVGSAGSGTLAVSGTAAVNVSGAAGLRIGNFSGSNGTVNLGDGSLGGAITTTSIGANLGASSTFNFNGGTLRASAANAAFMSGLNQAKILAGGAIIDTNSFNIGVAQPMLSGVANDGGLTKQGAGTLTIGANNTYTGATAVSGGTVAFNVSQTNMAGGITVASGATAGIVAAGDTTGTINAQPALVNGAGDPSGYVPGDKYVIANNVTVAAGGKFDVNDGILVINSGTFSAVNAAVHAGRIFSSTSQYDANNLLGLTGLGMGDNFDLSYAGISANNQLTITGSLIPAATDFGQQFIFKYTYIGDANLDGKVTTSDYDFVFGNLGSTTNGVTGNPVIWGDGDFNGNGVVDTTDLDNLFANLGFGTTGNVQPPLLPGTSVPEPSSVALLLLGLAGSAALCFQRTKLNVVYGRICSSANSVTSGINY